MMLQRNRLISALNGIMLVSVCVMLFWGCNYRSIVFHGYTDTNNRVELATYKIRVPNNLVEEVIIISDGRVIEKRVLMTDSSVIYIGDLLGLPSPTAKYFTDSLLQHRNEVVLLRDTMTFTGIDGKTGEYWKDIVLRGLSLGYARVDSTQLSDVESILSSLERIK